jgi:hypothetical protein
VSMTRVGDVSYLADVALFEDIKNVFLPRGLRLFFAHDVDFS